VHPRVAELAVAQAADGVVFVEALRRLGGGLHVPFEERQAERRGDLPGEFGLAGAGFALDQERAFERNGGIDRDHQIRRRNVVRRTRETHGFSALAPAVSQVT
jgi:hypothetical protein